MKPRPAFFAKRRPGNAHELFSANSMSACRILGPGGAERASADAVGEPRNAASSWRVSSSKLSGGSLGAAPQVALVWVQAAAPSILRNDGRETLTNCFPQIQ